MAEVRPGPIRPAPAGWSAQRVIAMAFPAMAALYKATQHELRAIEARLDHAETGGHNTSSPRQALTELRWRFEYTADTPGAAAALNRLRVLAARPMPPGTAATDAEGSYGTGTTVWFLKLDASVDHWLAADAEASGKPPRLLDRVNDPDRLLNYLESLLVSRPAMDGVDRRKELNFATADLVRLILRRRPPNYPWDPRLDAVIRRFVAGWQDPATGFFGAAYEVDGTRFRTADLSMTFHMARYLDGGIGYWPQLIDTLIEMRDGRYPNGWLDEAGMTSHNNYDVAILFQLGWGKMRADQRRRAQQELGRLVDWCRDTAIAEDGSLTARAVAESWPESYYFTIAFLDTVGYFDPAKRFWTDRVFAEAAALKVLLESRVRQLDQAQPMARMALDRLRGS